MAVTSVRAVWFPTNFFIEWRDDVVQIRALYRERKYRRCVILCSELLEDATHPVHRTYLYFYQAVCYESLGHIAHNYSSNRIPLFEQARDAFIAASEVLPLPFLTTIDGEYETPKPSPSCATFDIAALYDAPTPSSIYPSPSPKAHIDQADNRADSAAPYIEALNDSSVPDFDKYSPRQAISLVTPPHNGSSRTLLCTPYKQSSVNHKARLSQSLSSQHTLAEELVPSPLFSRGPSSKKEHSTHPPHIVVPYSINLLPLVTLSKPLPPTPNNRPLPDLPFRHKPQLVRKGKRFVVVPRRKTALSTLISRFEGTASLDDSRYAEREDQIQAKSEMSTPSTERFRHISNVFQVREDHIKHVQAAQSNLKGGEENESDMMLKTENGNPDRDDSRLGSSSPCDKQDSLADKENMKPLGETSMPHTAHMKLKAPTYAATIDPQMTLTPCPITRCLSKDITSTITIHSPSTNLESYNDSLSTFRARLTLHTRTVTKAISQTQNIQLAHEQEKRARFIKMHTRVSSHDHDGNLSSQSQDQLDPFAPSTPPSKSNARSRNSRITPTKDARLRSFWSLQAAEAAESLKKKTDQDQSKHGADTESARSKRARIERLKNEGWRTGKDKVGFKGVEWYARFRGIVEAELLD